MGHDTETLTLTDFLLARIAEDEEWARWGRLFDDPSDPDSATKILRWDHARLRAECDAKRRIVELHTGTEWGANAGDDDPWMCDHCRDQLWPCLTLRALASAYADHPDYREEWRP